MWDVHTVDCLFDNEDRNRNHAETLSVAMFLEEFNTWRESGISWWWQLILIVFI
jgi:hypothetical protein